MIALSIIGVKSFLRAYHNFIGYIRTAAFGPAGAWIVVSKNGGDIHVLDTATDKQLAELKGTYAPLLSLQAIF